MLARPTARIGPVGLPMAERHLVPRLTKPHHTSCWIVAWRRVAISSRFFQLSGLARHQSGPSCQGRRLGGTGHAATAIQPAGARYRARDCSGLSGCRDRVAAVVAAGWLAVTSVIPGARSSAQLADNPNAAPLLLTAGEQAEITRVPQAHRQGNGRQPTGHRKRRPALDARRGRDLAQPGSGGESGTRRAG